MKFYIVYNRDFNWHLVCTDNIDNLKIGDEFFWQEIDYDEFIFDLNFMKGMKD